MCYAHLKNNLISSFSSLFSIFLFLPSIVRRQIKNIVATSLSLYYGLKWWWRWWLFVFLLILGQHQFQHFIYFRQMIIILNSRGCISSHNPFSSNKIHQQNGFKRQKYLFNIPNIYMLHAVQWTKWHPAQRNSKRKSERKRERENAIYDIFQTDNKVPYNILLFWIEFQVLCLLLLGTIKFRYTTSALFLGRSSLPLDILIEMFSFSRSLALSLALLLFFSSNFMMNSDSNVSVRQLCQIVVVLYEFVMQKIIYYELDSHE